MSPQARQQLQQLTPQMRYVVLQRILQQQEVSMQRSQQSQNQPQQTQQPGQNPAQMMSHPNPQQAVFGPSQGPMNQLNQGKRFFLFFPFPSFQSVILICSRCPCKSSFGPTKWQPTTGKHYATKSSPC